MSALTEKVVSAYLQIFQSEPSYTILSPGRINIIGEHVDYNDGFVLPAAINKYVCFAIAESGSSSCTLVALDLDKTYAFDLTDEISPVADMWVNYILGVVAPIKKELKGFNLVFSSTIPMGSGLSSSAAVECGAAFALNTLFDLGLSKEQLAKLGQQAEHTFVGVKCGIMDQFASVFGKANQVIKLDCNTLTYDYFPADLGDYCLVLLDSKVKHTHLTSGYNTRREEVEAGLNIIKQAFPEVNTYRDCTMEHVESVKDRLGAIRYKRCSYVVKEIKRVGEAVQALASNNFEALGKLINATHEGLSADYEVSCDELDFLVAQAQNIPDVLGARMMGGGFGGCTINLLKKSAISKLEDEIQLAYKKRFGIDLEVYQVAISEGTHLYNRN
ncbi:MAG: galactokinase [Sphingobacteriales bacterium]|nr:galactokinase [Sphingobacteriales bacterium]